MLTIKKTHLINRNILTILSMTMLLTGCANEIEAPQTFEPELKQEVKNISMDPSTDINNREFSQIEQCAKELDALKTTNPQSYAKLQSQFDLMIATVNKYSQVRGSLKLQTQDTVQALYTYKVSIICNDIEQSLLNGLTSMVSLTKEGGPK